MKWLLIALLVIVKMAPVYILGLLFLFIGWAFSGPGYKGQPILLLGIVLLIGAIGVTAWLIRKAARETTAAGASKVSVSLVIGGLIAVTLFAIVSTFLLMQRETKEENAIMHERLTKIAPGYVDLMSLTVERPANSDWANLLIELSILKEGEYALKAEFAPPARHFKVESPSLSEETVLNPVRSFSAKPGVLQVRGQIDISRLKKSLTESKLTLKSVHILVKTGGLKTNSLIPGFQLVYRREDPISWLGITSSAVGYKQSVLTDELGRSGSIEVGSEMRILSNPSNSWIARLCKEKIAALNDNTDFQGVNFGAQTVKVSNFLWLIADMGLVGLVLDAPESYLEELSIISDSSEQFPAQLVDSPGCASRVRIVRYPNAHAEIGAKQNLKIHPAARMPVTIIAF